MSSPTVIGVDPGGRYTGVVVRQGDALHAHTVIERKQEDICEYVNKVIVGIHRLIVEMPVGFDYMACEDVKPMPHLRANPQGTFIACKVIGGLMATWTELVMVPPGQRHGLRPLLEYPEDLVGAHEVVGGGKLQHCRSAWDVAGSASPVPVREAA